MVVRVGVDMLNKVFKTIYNSVTELKLGWHYYMMRAKAIFIISAALKLLLLFGCSRLSLPILVSAISLLWLASSGKAL
jgi:hypothetical protein